MYLIPYDVNRQPNLLESKRFNLVCDFLMTTMFYLWMVETCLFYALGDTSSSFLLLKPLFSFFARRKSLLMLCVLPFVVNSLFLLFSCSSILIYIKKTKFLLHCIK